MPHRSTGRLILFGFAHVLLPLDGAEPAAAIRASLAGFHAVVQATCPTRGSPSTTRPSGCAAHEARLTFGINDGGELEIEGPPTVAYVLDSERIMAEMRRRRLEHWVVRFADAMHLEAFFDGFCVDNVLGTARDPGTGRYGRWLNGLGRWDW